ncbi:MAG: ATP-dependent helicase/nuclease subunit, partial [Alphaproteobacteria bacterium]|nr:ATP-dependent helicase/nuclease subunit [Alphaproteobacteria bacterium]
AKLRRKERCDLHPSDPRATLGDDELQAAADLVVELTAALGQFECLRPGPHCFAELAQRHRAVIAALSGRGTGLPAAFAGADGKMLDEALQTIAESPPAEQLRVRLDDYCELFDTAIRTEKMRETPRTGARVRILGTLEARLSQFDRVVLGGLNEGTWPPETRSDAWLSRPMRLALGLDLPERRISLSAHDFAQMLGAREVILTRAAKAGGAPAVASRFVQRLAAVSGERWDAVRGRGEQYLSWARMLDTPSRPPQPAARPEPRPPRAARPTRLSVTAIEDWLRDPYTIYAKHILRLMPLDAVDTPPGAADRGTVIHGAIGDFTQAFATALPPDPYDALIELGRAHFAAIEDYPEARAFWWPRYQRIARWFADWESKRRTQVAAVHAEIRGELEIPLGARAFRLSARADRIERGADGSYAILDYKTGQTPTAAQVKSGLAPQLTLEGAILRAGCFPDLPKGVSISTLLYVQLRGGEPAGELKAITWKDTTPDAEADRALEKLTELATRFEDETTPYRSRERPMFARRGYGDYDHLARVREWSLSGGAGDDPGGGE